MASEGSDRLEASGRVIANFAWQHRKAAVLLRDHVKQIENENLGQPFGAFFETLRAYCSACIMSSTASLEAFINELFIAHGGQLRAALGNFEKEFWGRRGIEGKPILKKYDCALKLLGQTPLLNTTSPYLDALALIELRNALVHYKPTWDADRRRKVDLVAFLRQCYRGSPFFADDGGDFVSMKSMSADCAEWAVNTPHKFVTEFFSRAGLDENKTLQFLMLR